MTKERWILAIILAALGVFVFTMVSYADRHFPGGMGMGHMYRMNMVFDELKVTDDQRVALKKLFKEHHKAIHLLREGLMVKRRALMELILADKPDQAAIRQASADLGSAIGDAASQAAVLAKEARAILTPEQVERFKQMRLKRQKVFDETLREWKEQGSGF